MTDKVHSFLMKPRRIRSKIRQTQSQIEGLRLSLLPGAIRYDKDKVQGKCPTDQMAEYAARLDELEHKLEELREEYLEAQDAIVEAAGRLVEDEYGATIIMLRYLSDADFSEIAAEISMTERNMFRYYKTAVEALDQVVSECQ